MFISDDFTYKHTPYVGLGVETRYVDESLLITKVLNDSIQKYLQVGDRVYEHNNEIVDSLGLVTTGPIGEKQKLIVIKKGKETLGSWKFLWKSIILRKIKTLFWSQ